MVHVLTDICTLMNGRMIWLLVCSAIVLLSRMEVMISKFFTCQSWKQKSPSIQLSRLKHVFTFARTLLLDWPTFLFRPWHLIRHITLYESLHLSEPQFPHKSNSYKSNSKHEIMLKCNQRTYMSKFSVDSGVYLAGTLFSPFPLKYSCLKTRIILSLTHSGAIILLLFNYLPFLLCRKKSCYKKKINLLL